MSPWWIWNQQRGCLSVDTGVTQRWCGWGLGTADVWKTHSQGAETATDPKNFAEPWKCTGVGGGEWHHAQCKRQLLFFFQENLVIHKTSTTLEPNDFKFKWGVRGLNDWKISSKSFSHSFNIIECSLGVVFRAGSYMDQKAGPNTIWNKARRIIL